MKNIQIKGYKQTSSGTDDYRRGDEIRPTIVGTINETFKILNVVSESQPSSVVGQFKVTHRIIKGYAY